MQSVHTINRNTKFISRSRLITRVVFLLLLTFHLSLFTSAQQIHPVTTAVQLVPPYSVYLPDYAAPGNDKLRVILTLNDITQPSYRVKLALKVELNGRLIMQTNPAFQPQPLDLLPGQPVIISGAQLSDYLSPQHLQFSGGFSRESYERTKSLPEGAYRICFTAYDYNRPDRVQLSNEGCNMFFFKKSEPPVLNLPFHRSRVEDKTPQFLTFSWSDRNTPSMQGGAWSRPSYRFELFEVRPVGSNPEYIVRSSKPLFSTTTEQTNLVYGPAEPVLQDSMQYVWRVQAFDREGRDAYSNSGYSQAYLFTYGGQDPFQVNQIGRPAITGESLSERSGRWNWTAPSNSPEGGGKNPSNIEGWKIQYRKRTTPNDQPPTNFDWNSEELSDTLLSLFNLEADNAYEARVQARVKGFYGPWSEIAVFRTLPKRVFECGQDYEQPETNTGQPLQAATAGMLVRVGDFDMQLLKVEGSNGFFSGYGAVTTPLLGMRVNVKFTGIGINDKLVMTSGEVVALSEGLPEWVNERIEVQKDVKVIKGWTETMPDFETATLEELQAFAQELLQIEEAIFQDTYVYSEAERKEVQGYIAEVKSTMEALQDSDPANDDAAKAKLRKTLKAAKPLLQKLSDKIGKGVLVKLGLIRDELYTELVEEHIQLLEQALSDLPIESSVNDKGPYVSAYEWITNPTCWDNYTPEKKAAILAFLKKHKKDKKLFDDFKQELDAAIRQKQAIDTSFQQLEQYVAEWRKEHPGQNKTAKEIVESLDAYIGVSRDRFCGVIYELWQRAQLAQKFSDEHRPVLHKVSSATANQLWNSQLSQWLGQHGISAKFYLHKVAEGEVATRQAGGNQAAAKDAAAREFDEGSFSQNIALWIEHNEQTGELEMYLKFRKGYLKPGPYANGRSGDWFAQKIIDRINRKLSQSSWDRPLLQKQEIAGGSDGRYRSEELNVFEWAAFGMEELGHVVNHAEMNVHLWNDIDDKAAYNKSVLNIWAPVAGGGDQALAEVKDLYELVEFTGDIIENPALVKDIYNSVASLSYEDIKGMVQKGLEEKKAQYQKGGTVMQYHTTRDGIQAVILVAGAVKGVPALIKKGGSWIKQFKQLVKEVPHANVRAQVQSLSTELAERFVKDFGDGSTNLLKRLKEDPFVFDDWYGSIQSGFIRINVKGRLNQLGEYTVESINGVKLKWKKLSNVAIDFGDRKDLRKVLNLTDEGMEAHHKLPWKVCENNRVIQEAAKDGFHPNMPENGVGLSKYKAGGLDEIGLHANHPKYDEWINKKLNEWSASNGNRYTPEEANLFIQKELILDLDELINAAKSSNKNLNDFFRDLL